VATSNLMLKILAVDKASGTLGKIGGSMGGLGKKAGALAGALGAALSVGAVAKFAGDSVKAFETTGKETLKLQRFMGGTAEEASRLGHAFTMSGIDSETSAKNIGILSKHLVANDKAAKGMGVAYRDAHGKLKPMDQILPGMADKFKNMPNGPEKTALALKLFGRGGAAMIPMLNKGSAGLKAMAAESDKLGTTLSGKDLEAVKQSTINKRKMGEAVKGLQIAIGKNL